MEVLSSAAGMATVNLTAREVATIKGALNEVCNGVRIEPFEIRVGVGKAEAVKLLAEVLELYRAQYPAREKKLRAQQDNKR
jgi:hypothetical protein